MTFKSLHGTWDLKDQNKKLIKGSNEMQVQILAVSNKIL